MNVKKSVILAFLVAVGILLQLLESFVGIFMIVPGYKIGLANIAGLFALYIYDEKSLAYVSLLRIFLSSLMQGTLFSVSFYLSLSGGILACIAMIIAYRSKVFSIYGVSILGACFHNIGQVIAITWIYQQYFMQLFLPILLALSIVSGILIAVVCKKSVKSNSWRILWKNIVIHQKVFVVVNSILKLKMELFKVLKPLEDAMVI